MCIWVAAARGEEFGYTSAFSSTGGSAQGKQIATKVVLGESGTLVSITAHISGPVAQHVRYAIYADAAGEPGVLIAQTAVAEFEATALHWQTVAAPPVVLSAGTYWLAMNMDHSSASYAFANTGGQSRISSNDAVAGGFTSIWGASSTTNTASVSIYARYTPTDAIFTDVSTATGFAVSTTTALARGSSIHWADLDSDGDLDAILTGDSTARLLRNSNAGASFVATPLGTGDVRGSGALLDMENDGDVDYWAANLANASQEGLFANDGTGTLAMPDPIGLFDPSNTGSCAAGDVNGDGRCDLVMFSGNGNWLGLNIGDTALALTATADSSHGLNNSGDKGNGGYCSSGDINGDGTPDFFYHYGGGRLFLSAGDGTYARDNRGISVVTAQGKPVGSAWADFDNDGDLDLFCSRHDVGERGTLWRNNGSLFTEIGSAAGILDVTGQRGVAWGDMDNDGDLDLYIATGGATPNALYRNNGDGSFTRTGEGAEADGDGADASFVDYDNDGDLDLAVTRVGDTAILLRNNTNSSRYLKVRAIGWGSHGTNRAAIGVRVDVLNATGSSLIARRDVGVAKGLGGSETLWVHFGGLDPNSLYTVRVHFLSGIIEQVIRPSEVSTTINGHVVAQMLTVEEPAATPRLLRWAEVEP